MPLNRVTPRRTLGTSGEKHARHVLESQGYRHVAASWRGGGGEIDLIMADGDELVFIEVKTRRGDHAGRAEDAVSPRQIRALMRAAHAYVAEAFPADEPIWRFDLVALTVGPDGRLVDFRHIENALTMDGISS